MLFQSTTYAHLPTFEFIGMLPSTAQENRTEQPMPELHVPTPILAISQQPSKTRAQTKAKTKTKTKTKTKKTTKARKVKQSLLKAREVCFYGFTF